jgi:tetratricopeptide (TPR) repeat protein
MKQLIVVTRLITFIDIICFVMSSALVAGSELATDGDEDTRIAIANRANPSFKEQDQKVSELLSKAYLARSRRYFTVARPLHEEAYELCRKNLGDNHFRTREVLIELEFHDWLTSLNGEDFKQMGRVGRQMESGSDLVRQLRYADAARVLSEATAEIEGFKSPVPMRYCTRFQIDYVMALVASGKIKDAISIAESTKKLIHSTFGNESPHAAKLLLKDALIHRRLGNDYEVLRCCGQACRILERCGQAESLACLEPLSCTLDSLIELEEFEQAHACLEKSKRLLDQLKDQDRAERLELRMIEIQLLVAQHRDNEALQKISEAVEPPNRASARTDLFKGVILLRSGDTKTAGPLIRGACAAVLPMRNFSEYARLPYHHAYAQVLIQEGNDTEAARYLANVLQVIEGEGANDIILCKLLKLYVHVLTNLGRTEEANRIEAKRIEMCATVEEMRRQIKNDPGCKFSWENKLIPGVTRMMECSLCQGAEICQ